MKLKIVIIVLVVMVIALGILAGVNISKVNELKNEIARLQETDVSVETGCNPFAPDGTAPVVQETDLADREESVADSDKAAEFDGGYVSVDEAREEYGLVATYYYGLGQSEEEFGPELKMTVLETLAEEKVLYAKAQSLNLTELTEEQMKEIENAATLEFEDNVAYYSQFRYDESKSDEEIRNETIEFLNNSGLSYDEILEKVKEDAWRGNLYVYATANAEVTDEALKELYDTQVVSDELNYSVNPVEYEADADAGRTMTWNPGGVRRMDTILIPFTPEQSARIMEINAEIAAGSTEHMGEIANIFSALRSAADEIKQRLDSGERFEDIQKEFGALHAGGTYVFPDSTLCGDEFRETALQMKNIGDISDPVETDYGITILRYAEDVPEGPVPFESIKDTLKENYTEEYKQELYSATVQQWIAEANIHYYPERL